MTMVLLLFQELNGFEDSGDSQPVVNGFADEEVNEYGLQLFSNFRKLLTFIQFIYFKWKRKPSGFATICAVLDWGTQSCCI